MARWIDQENYHITLRFIGDVDYATAAEVTARSTGSPIPRPDIKLSHLGAFGGDKPRALFAGVENNATRSACRRPRSACCSGWGSIPTPASSCRT